MFYLATVKKQISEVQKYFQNTFENMAKFNILSKKIGRFLNQTIHYEKVRSHDLLARAKGF
jgi:hypothetical protein